MSQSPLFCFCDTHTKKTSSWKADDRNKGETSVKTNEVLNVSRATLRFLFCNSSSLHKERTARKHFKLCFYNAISWFHSVTNNTVLPYFSIFVKFTGHLKDQLSLI